MSAVELTIDQLQLDLKNPRFDGLANQKEALEKMLLWKTRQFVNLADDIVTKGLSPVNRLLVTPAKGLLKGKFTVLDGNRRTAALRILSNPAALDEMKLVGDATKKQLREIAKTFSAASVEPIDAFVMEDEQEARHWIEALHTGENDGRGQIDWDGIATARYRGKSTSLHVLSLVKASGKFTPEEEAGFERFPITNLDRLLATPEVRDRLGLQLDSGELQTDLPPAEILRALRRIVLDIARRDVRVTDIDSKADRVAYIKKLGGKVLPDLAKRTGKPVSVESLTGTVSANSTAVKRSTTRSKVNRKALIPTDCRLTIDDAKCEEIYIELRKLSLESYPTAIAALSRVFIELSMDHYGDKKMTKWDVNLTLKKKIEAVASDLQGRGARSRDLQAFRRLASNPNGALSVDRLHGVIHSKLELPNGSELRKAWDEVQPFFQKIWAP